MRSRYTIARCCCDCICPDLLDPEICYCRDSLMQAPNNHVDIRIDDWTPLDPVQCEVPYQLDWTGAVIPGNSDTDDWYPDCETMWGTQDYECTHAFLEAQWQWYFTVADEIEVITFIDKVSASVPPEYDCGVNDKCQLLTLPAGPKLIAHMTHFATGGATSYPIYNEIFYSVIADSVEDLPIRCQDLFPLTTSDKVVSVNGGIITFNEITFLLAIEAP